MLLGGVHGGLGAVEVNTIEALRAGLEQACLEQPVASAPLLAALGGGRVTTAQPLEAADGVSASRRVLELDDGGRLRLDEHLRGEQRLRVILELSRPQAGVVRPVLWIAADHRCRPRAGRRLGYDARGVPASLQALGPKLDALGDPQPLDAAVPPRPALPGVPVALVDSGVNYTLAPLAERLARDASGQMLGYDFWDLDERPFDAHPGGSPFFPRRHGTRTASVLLADAEVATIAPYRYPRPDMRRMADLLAHADGAGIRIMNLSLGGTEAGEWQAFEAAARARPHMLFIASAGNDGRDIDARPVYPAALTLPNLVVVTSADDEGRLARGSNWGRHSVDLMVPAESLVGMNYQGFARPLAGSSHAAARVSALAACLLAAHPEWQADALRAALFAAATPPPQGDRDKVAIGLIEAPTARPRGKCRARPRVPRHRAVLRPSEAAFAATGAAGPLIALAPLSLYLPRDGSRTVEQVLDALADAQSILGQCAVSLGQVEVHLVELPRRLHFFTHGHAVELVAAFAPAALSVWLLEDTLASVAYDAQAIGRSNAGRAPRLAGSVWITRHLPHLGVGVAHELVHILTDTGHHVPETDNLMHQDSSPKRTRLASWQCDRLRRVAAAQGWLARAAQDLGG